MQNSAHRLGLYLSVARLDHWFKNIYVFSGIAVFIVSKDIEIGSVFQLGRQLGLAFIFACLVSSTNYIINAIIDSPQDRHHPKKKARPVPRGLLSTKKLWIMAFIFLGTSILGAWFLMPIQFVLSLIVFFIVGGIAYNVPPIRTKEIVYIDVLTESMNGPIRLFLGWFALTTQLNPPVMLILMCWFFAAFLMTSKRYAEYRFIGDAGQAAAYRSSFRWYTEKSLFRMMVVCIVLFICALIVFILTYSIYRLFVILPFLIVLIGWFFKLAKGQAIILREPEWFWKEALFTAYCVFIALIVLSLIML